MLNCQEFSELIRTGNLDFALLKPIDTQFVISFQRMEWSSLSNFALGLVLMSISLWNLTQPVEDIVPGTQAATHQVQTVSIAATEPTAEAQSDTAHEYVQKAPIQISPLMIFLYPFYLLCGVGILYSVMIALASSSIWLGRNQTLYNFWFYITNFSRYPMEIYNRGWGRPLFGFFTFVVPILVVVNVPARLLAQPLSPRADWEWPLAGFAVIATILSLILSRFIFVHALKSYRSASS